MTETVDRRLQAVGLARRIGVLAAIDVAESPRLRSRFGPKGGRVVTAVLGELIARGGQLPEQHSPRSGGGFWIFLPETGFYAAHERLRQLSRQVAETVVDVLGERVRVTPIIGYATFGDATTSHELCEQASVALHDAALHLDLVPVKYSRTLAFASTKPGARRDRLSGVIEKFWPPLQIGFIFSVLLDVPFIAYVLSWRAGFDLTTVTYPLLAVGLAAAAVAVWLACFRIAAKSNESRAAVQPVAASLEAAMGAPPATAIVAAYLGSESTTIVDTITALLEHDYPGDLQVILVYTASNELPIEGSLSELAVQDPRLFHLRAKEGTSKAELVSAALPHVRGEFVGIFDADSHLDQGSFSCAWRWISKGHAIVRGHRVVRNGEVSWVTRLVAADYEATQALSDPERGGLNGFGVFGGSNSYWRTDALRKIGTQRLIQPKGTNSSMRDSQDAFAIGCDPLLLSSELAPTTLRALWEQRMHWAKERMSAPQEIGRRTSGSGWMQTIPWMSLQVVPILGFVVWRDGGFGKLNQLIPLFAILVFFVLSVGAAQGAFAYQLGNPRIKRHRAWFVVYAFNSAVWFSEFKGLIGRVARYKGAIGNQPFVMPMVSSETRLSSRPPTLLDWSYDLLSECERVMLCRLSVFAGGWNLAAAEAVAVPDSADVSAVADVLRSLVDKSIVQTDQTAFDLRYCLPGQIHQFAAEKLAESSDQEFEIRSAHARFFLNFAEKSEPELRGIPRVGWLDLLEADHDNLLVAIATFLADPSTGSVALRIIMALFPFFEARHPREWLEAFTAALSTRAGEQGNNTLTAEALGVLGDLVKGPEQRRCLEKALAIVRSLGDSALKAEILSFLSSCAFNDGDLSLSAESAEEAVSIARIVGDQGLLGRALVSKATAQSAEDLLGACAVSREAITALRVAGDRNREAAATANLATFERHAGEIEPAAVHYSEALLLAEELGNKAVVSDILGNMGELALIKGDLVGAVELYSRALRGVHWKGRRRSCTYLLLGVAICLSNMSAEQEEAATLAGAADAQNEQLGTPWEPWIRDEREKSQAGLKRSMRGQAFETAYAHGRGLALDDAVTLALEVASKIPLPPLDLVPASGSDTKQRPLSRDGGRTEENEGQAPSSHTRAGRHRAERG